MDWLSFIVGFSGGVLLCLLVVLGPSWWEYFSEEVRFWWYERRSRRDR
jgi:hypothetical protein